MNVTRSGSLRSAKNVFYVIAVFVAAAALGVWGVHLAQERRDALVRAEASTQDIAVVLEEHARRTFEVSDLIAESVLGYVEQKGGLGAVRTDPQAHAFLNEQAAKIPTGGAVWIIDATGRTVLASGGDPAPAEDLSDRKWFKVQTESGRSRGVGEAFFSRMSKEATFIYSRRIEAGGKFGGVVAISLRPSFFSTALMPKEYAPGGVLAMFRNDGQFIVRTPFSPDMIGRDVSDTALFTTYAERQSGTYRGTTPAGERDRIVSFRRLEDLSVVVLAAVAIDDVLASWRAGFVRSSAMIGILLSGLAGLTFLGVRLSHTQEQTGAALRQALADKDMLFREVHHRVKNNLQVTSNLLLLQAAELEKEPSLTKERVGQAFDETQARLGSIGLIHETLYRTDRAATVALNEYLARLLQGLTETYAAAERNITVHQTLEPCSIDLDRAVPLGLTVTEVITNAFKHAFPPGQGGQLAVALQCGDGEYCLEIRDNGRGIPVERREGALGLQLVKGLVKQARASCTILNESGTVFRMRIPAEG